MCPGWIIVIIALIAFLIYSTVSNNISEGYGKVGIASMPMNVYIPPHVYQTNGVVDYSNIDFNKLCPTPPGAGKWCKNHNDCPGEAELCYNSAYGPVVEGTPTVQEESNYCTCSIQNACIEPGVC